MSASPKPIDTPPGTTLSTPSPTELHDTDPLATDMAPTQISRATRHIYLVVATTPVRTASGPRLGIGLDGQLPWPMIKADMAYFRKVTTDGQDHHIQTSQDASTTNSVIMGRRTYESIPPGFRPLTSRRNYVITRSNLEDLSERYRKQLIGQMAKARRSVQERYANGNKPQSTDLGTNSIEYREMQLSESEFTSTTEPDMVQIKSSNNAVMPLTVTSDLNKAVENASTSSQGALFCIGGAEIYKMFLQNQELRPRLRILQTEVQKLKEGEQYECDTLWPEDFSDTANGWKEASQQETVNWTGIELPQGEDEWSVNDRVGVRIRVRGWEQEQIRP